MFLIWKSDNLLFLKKWANPGLFFVYFESFQTNNTIFTINKCEKMSCPSTIWRNSNPRSSEHESPPITTRPGLPPYLITLLGLISYCCSHSYTYVYGRSYLSCLFQNMRNLTTSEIMNLVYLPTTVTYTYPSLQIYLAVNVHYTNISRYSPQNSWVTQVWAFVFGLAISS